ncbi:MULTISPECIES: ABC transporter substrate-binding protein [Streptomyces diastaticus group]|uniref:ABC transporter substrate-binding protein n=1 Tax=Streptomyces gougerotii TaxID=53448 RepID=A0A8H9HV98_9ACTN|nr:ABC transporter substrate-binding protein [Streptomyces gougerotii]GFH78089.1 ABC transporter substrate-binding protein [Streptomyces gougerotii]GGU80704.1 ABC transporter substrate-binding protein [Streptomyces gougerotii]
MSSESSPSSQSSPSSTPSARRNPTRTGVRRPLLALGAAALLVPVAACGGSPGDSGSGSGDQRLRAVMAFPPAQAMSPYGDDAVTLSRLSVIEGLTRIDEDGAAVPALATKWRRDGDKGWEFTLRDARFQDGGAVDAEAVVRSLTAAQAASPRPRVLSDVRLTVEAGGERTVRVTTDEADPLLPQRFANPSLAILSEAAYEKGAKGTQVNPAGHATGPYTLTKVNGAVSATLERNDTYWGGKAQAPGVDVKFVADGTARANALRTGSADIAEYVPVAQVSLLEEKQIHEVPTARTNTLYLNTGRGAFADPAIRAAARAAIDSKALVDGVYEGRADTARGLLGPGVPWAADAREAPEGRAEPAGRAEVAKTKQIVLATYTNRPELPEVASAVQQQLEARGFTVKQYVRDYAQMEADALAGRYDAFIQARNTLLDTADPVSYLGSDFTCEGSFNISQLCDQGVDEAVAKAAGADGLTARHTAEMRAEAKILGADAAVPLVHERFVQGFDSGKVAGVALDPMERRLITADTRLR